MYNFRNIDQLTLHCSFNFILFVIIIAVLDVDRVAEKYSRKSIVHMSTSWLSSKFSFTNAARTIQISLALRPLLRNKINNYTCICSALFMNLRFLRIPRKRSADLNMRAHIRWMRSSPGPDAYRPRSIRRVSGVRRCSVPHLSGCPNGPRYISFGKSAKRCTRPMVRVLRKRAFL